MTENEFHLSFNLHKACLDIGIRDDDRAKLSCIYNIPPERLDTVLAEFENRNRESAEAVLRVCGAPDVNTEKKFRVAFLGDSITSYRMSYRCILQRIFAPYPNITIKDFSVSGLKASDIFTAYYPAIRDFKPAIAVVMVGTNDMRITDDEYQYPHTPVRLVARNYAYLVEKLGKTGCAVLAVTLPPFCMKKIRVALNRWSILLREDVRKEYDDVIAGIARNNDAVLIDMREEYEKYDPSDITMEDGLHLNLKGHRILTKKIYLEMTKLLK